jgi:hypothetical protein
MRRQRVVRVAESAKVDDAAHAGACGRSAEIAGRTPIDVSETRSLVHRVHQVERLMHAVHRLRQCDFVEAVAGDDLGRRAARGNTRRLARETSHRPTAFLEHSKKAAADVTAGAGQQDQWSHMRSRYWLGGSRTVSTT